MRSNVFRLTLTTVVKGWIGAHQNRQRSLTCSSASATSSSPAYTWNDAGDAMPHKHIHTEQHKRHTGSLQQLQRGVWRNVIVCASLTRYVKASVPRSIVSVIAESNRRLTYATGFEEAARRGPGIGITHTPTSVNFDHVRIYVRARMVNRNAASCGSFVLPQIFSRSFCV